MAKLPSLSAIRLIVALVFFVQSRVYADGYAHDGGLWGSIKEPIRDSVKDKYDGLSDTGRFCVGMGVGFGCTKMVIRTTVRAAKTVGAAYIAFEALEYAGLLKEARNNKENRALLEKSRDYVLRTMDGIRHDIRETLNPAKIRNRIDEGMKKDKAGTVGCVAGTFMGCLL